MKKLLAFAMILAIGLFTAVGCEKKAETKKTEKTTTEKVDKPGEKTTETKTTEEKK